MRFWDTSAIVALLVDEPHSEQLHDLLTVDLAIAASFITPVEIRSALMRRTYAKQLDAAGHDWASRLFAALSEDWIESDEYQPILAIALDLLTRHPLRAGDAIQLASALVVSGTPAALPFVTLDRDLGEAARKEGFPVLP